MITGILKSPVNSNLLLQNPRDYLLLLLLLFSLVTKMCLTLLEAHGLWPAGLLSHGIYQARILELAISFSRGSIIPQEFRTQLKVTVKML